MNNICCLILAAGEGKRMKSDRPKVLSEVLFKPMIRWVVDMVKKAGIDDICIVTGFKRNILNDYLEKEGIEYTEAFQEEQKGTAHAVGCAADFLKSHKDSDVVILNGDAPFVDAETLKNSLYKHRKNSASATVITSEIDNPKGYGRIVRDGDTDIFKCIIEEKDATEEQRRIKEVNSGAYWFRILDLLNVLDRVENKNAQGEFYLTDTMELLLKNEKIVQTFLTENSDIVLGANDTVQLAWLNECARNKILANLIENGISIPCRDGIIISPDAVIGKKCTILPSTVIKGKTIVENSCTLGPNSVIIDCGVGENVTLSCVYCSEHNFTPGQVAEPMSTYIG